MNLSMWPPAVPASRSFPARAARFLRARLREVARGAELLADDPWTIRAWFRGWDAGHYGKLRALRDRGIRPAVIYDIGAYDGHWTEMAQAVFSPREIVLFEPQALLAESLRNRVPPSGGKWTIVQSALGDRVRSAEIHVTALRSASSLLPPGDSSPQARSITGDVQRESITEYPLDQLVMERSLSLPDLVKIDVQGYESKVLGGGGSTFAQAQVLIVETSIHPQYDGQPLLPEILSDLIRQGFELFDLTESFRWWPGPIWQVDLWMVRRPKLQ